VGAAWHFPGTAALIGVGCGVVSPAIASGHKEQCGATARCLSRLCGPSRLRLDAARHAGQRGADIFALRRRALDRDEGQPQSDGLADRLGRGLAGALGLGLSWPIWRKARSMIALRRSRSGRRLAPQSIPFASRVRCLVALGACRRRTALGPELLAAGPATTDPTPLKRRTRAEIREPTRSRR
jgi:hypothetical protein